MPNETEAVTELLEDAVFSDWVKSGEFFDGDRQARYILAHRDEWLAALGGARVADIAPMNCDAWLFPKEV